MNLNHIEEFQRRVKQYDKIAEMISLAQVNVQGQATGIVVLVAFLAYSQRLRLLFQEMFSTGITGKPFLIESETLYDCLKTLETEL